MRNQGHYTDLSPHSGVSESVSEAQCLCFPFCPFVVYSKLDLFKYILFTVSIVFVKYFSIANRILPPSSNSILLYVFRWSHHSTLYCSGVAESCEILSCDNCKPWSSSVWWVEALNKVVSHWGTFSWHSSEGQVIITVYWKSHFYLARSVTSSLNMIQLVGVIRLQ